MPEKSTSKIHLRENGADPTHRVGQLFRTYAWHLGWCASLAHTKRVQPCDCGYMEALEEITWNRECVGGQYWDCRYCRSGFKQPCLEQTEANNRRECTREQGHEGWHISCGSTEHTHPLLVWLDEETP